MKLELKNIGVLVRDQNVQQHFEEVRSLFANHGVSVSLVNSDLILQEFDLVVAMGGDGTALRALDKFPLTPVLAINFGTVGFLTAGDRNDLIQIVELLVAGEYSISERLVLNCRYPEGQVFAVNEVMIRAGSKLVFTDVFVDETEIRTITGDGVIVGTPTGSTGHLLSTGAPIVLPDVRCIILDGVNEYNFSSRALILPPEASVRLQISEKTRDKSVSLMADGINLCQLSSGMEVFIQQADHRARLVYLDDRYFFRNLSSKLSW